jgi:hypothetical protein
MSTDDNTTDTDRRTTRSEHHAHSPDEQVRTAKDTLAWLLRRRDCREWAISSTALAEATGWRDPGDSGIAPTTVRDAIKELRRDRHLPIVACSQGYYLVTDPGEFQREIDRINDEIQTREETKRELCAAFNRYRGGAD